MWGAPVPSSSLWAFAGFSPVCRCCFFTAEPRTGHSTPRVASPILALLLTWQPSVWGKVDFYGFLDGLILSVVELLYWLPDFFPLWVFIAFHGLCVFLSLWTVNNLRFKALMSSCRFTVPVYHGSSLSIVTQLSCKLAVSLEVSSKVTQFCCVKTRPWITESWTLRRRVHTKLRCEISMSYAGLIPSGGCTLNSSCKVIWTTFKITGCLQEKPHDLSLLCTGLLPISVFMYFWH